jgi:hypothetical protein
MMEQVFHNVEISHVPEILTLPSKAFEPLCTTETHEKMNKKCMVHWKVGDY